ncbi:hypothetical protein NRB20_13950 [Nocardia sp. RB20]|uniref:Uncharacterized protein n=1 Tax=Nocardia macrotermitis TaxID=2585198 RepID=A0A7K0CZD7_9NOCA|nr:hypothetical protein [Nocardia macrotermitis]
MGRKGFGREAFECVLEHEPAQGVSVHHRDSEDESGTA